MARHVLDLTLLTRTGALLGTAFFLATTFRYGWTRQTSDFPNYYTAAVLVRQREPLHNYYDWTWFERRMIQAGFEQIGSYMPQSPLAMLPLVGFAGLPSQTVKRIWLAANLAFLITTLWLLSRMTRFRVDQLAVLTLLGYGTLHFNFLYGQYYVLILFLLTLAFYFLRTKDSGYSGLLLAVAFALKLYGGPFLFYLGAKRCWRALVVMLSSSICLGLTAVAIFGWHDIAYFATRILPRALEGETLDPYSSLNGTLPTLLRRAFVLEPELNPHPLWNAPHLFFFLRPFSTLLILALATLAVRKSSNRARDFALFFVAVMLISPNTGSYTFVLLLLPVILLLNETTLPQHALFLIFSYVLLGIPLTPAWSWLFPKIWLLLGLFLYAGRSNWSRIGTKAAITVTAAITMFSLISAILHSTSYSREPAQHWERIATQPGAMLSSSPAVLRSGIVYQAIADGGYVLRQFRDGRFDEFAFSGEAVHPVAQSPDGPIRFELLRHRTSAIMLFDPVHGTLTPDRAVNPSEAAAPSISPDKQWTAFTRSLGGNEQVWIQRTAGGAPIQITGGNCNSSSPAWELDSKAIVFQSDCGRGIGWTALYRAPLVRFQ